MQRKIEVRTIGGESTVILVSPDSRVADLKFLLSESLPPARQSTGFHLYFKGARLSLDDLISSLEIGEGEFMVLVPFAKKKRQLPLQLDPTMEGAEPSVRSQENQPSSAADSVWLDIMGDISSLNDIPSDDFGAEVDSIRGANGEESPVIDNPEKRRKSGDFKAIEDILCSDKQDFLGKNTSDKIGKFVDSISCLSDLNTGRCLLLEFCCDECPAAENCACPLWLKKVLKTFTLLNVLYAFFHSQRNFMTWSFLNETFKQPNLFGLDELCMLDVEKLSLLSPEVVMLLGTEEKVPTSLSSAIVIHYSSNYLINQTKITAQIKAARKPTTLAIVNAVEKRMIAFRTDLWRLIRCFMENMPAKAVTPYIPSLQDIITLKGSLCVPGCNTVNEAKTRATLPRCADRNNIEPTEMIYHLKKGIGISGQVVHIEEINAKLAVHVEIPDGLQDVTKASLNRMGISRLYSHQADALHASLSGKSIVVATSTSSGKSLCYNIHVVDALSKDLEACALYIFPTKALAQDQMRAFVEMTSGFDIGLNIGIYDGDTSQIHRTWIRDNARVLITNPDMLHLSIMPDHAKFMRIFSNLRIIVIDEAHTYKGAFGCHVALILRRLRRISLLVYGCNPLFIFCTATSANPREHAMELAGLQTVELIQNDGSPSSAKYFVLWNPPFRLETKSCKSRQKSLNWEISTRRTSPILETSHLFAEMIQHGLRCIAFCKTRKLSELVLCYTREILQKTASDLVDVISVYRGGYTPKERRRIEADLFENKLRGVAATNALELGIDLGCIDATLHLGFPGSIASLWQQAGRSGRRSRQSLAIYIAFEGPLDQYFMKFPNKLFRRSVEYCQVDGQNEKVLEQHLACAAVELPLCLQYDEKYFGPGVEQAIISLKNRGYVHVHPQNSETKCWSYIGPEDRPSMEVSIRSIESNKYKVIDEMSHEVLEEIEESKAFFQVYEGAVYMHQGDTYLVKSLELSEKIVFCQKADLKYYTKTRDYTDIHVMGGDIAYSPEITPTFASVRTSAQVNSCKVTTIWFGFHRIWRATNQIFDSVNLSLPSFSYISQATWIRVPQAIKAAVHKNELSFRAGLHAASHSLLNVVPLYMMCNASDMGTECANPHETRDIPERLLLYDRHPGGIGLSTRVQKIFGELLTAALELVSTCGCDNNTGCPNCVQVLSCGEYNEVLDKSAAILILDGVIEAEKLQCTNGFSS
ncbi:hypothetical protein HPP92_007735 [Vanilla planifolia]|uniref:Uncharacterized protein n=1 Tax=Vanilla planifolia TaxID=51239 RepID=A0A835RH75_VANPL|nr:hypothetical protein HPP92_007735 [Vanilla planifolia]